jgi:hypothetical protein
MQELVEKIALLHRTHVDRSRDRHVYPAPNFTEHLVSPFALPAELDDSDENWPSLVFFHATCSPHERPTTPKGCCVRAGSKHSPRREKLHCQTRDAFHCFGFSSPRSPCFPQPVTSLWRTRVHLFHLANGDS